MFGIGVPGKLAGCGKALSSGQQPLRINRRCPSLTNGCACARTQTPDTNANRTSTTYILMERHWRPVKTKPPVSYLVKTGNCEPIICNRTNNSATVVTQRAARRRDASIDHRPAAAGAALLLPISSVCSRWTRSHRRICGVGRAKEEKRFGVVD